MKFPICFLLIATILFSCEKGKADFTLKGTITDETFGGSLVGATIAIYEIEAGTTNNALIGASTIQSDGTYSFTFPRNMVESYLLTVRKSNYFEKDFSIPFSGMTIEEDNVRDYATTAKSWARLRFITSNPNAELRYTKQEGKTDCPNCCDDNEQYLYGITDLELICPNDGNTLYSYNYSIIGSGINGIKSATTTAFDTVNIVLNY